jgi:hypothetical protein
MQLQSGKFCGLWHSDRRAWRMPWRTPHPPVPRANSSPIMRRCADRDAAPEQSSLPDETSRRLSAVTLRRRCHVDHQPSPISLMLVKSTRAGGTATRARRCSGSHSGRCTRRSPFPAVGRRPSGVAMAQRFDTAFLVGLQKQGAHVASSVSSSNRRVVDGGALLSPAPPREPRHLRSDQGVA